MLHAVNHSEETPFLQLGDLSETGVSGTGRTAGGRPLVTMLWESRCQVWAVRITCLAMVEGRRALAVVRRALAVRSGAWGFFPMKASSCRHDWLHRTQTVFDTLGLTPSSNCALGHDKLEQVTSQGYVIPTGMY